MIGNSLLFWHLQEDAWPRDRGIWIIMAHWMLEEMEEMKIRKAEQPRSQLRTRRAHTATHNPD